MDSKMIVCTVCPLSCEVQLDYDPATQEVLKVSYNRCPKGKDYAIKEFTAPERTLTTTVRVEGGIHPLVPVRTDRTIPKPLLHKAMQETATIVLRAPIKMGDIVVENLLGTGANLIATRDI